MSATYYDPMGKKGGEDEGEKEREGGRGYSMSNFSCWREPLTNGAADKVSFFFLLVLHYCTASFSSSVTGNGGKINKSSRRKEKEEGGMGGE